MQRNYTPKVAAIDNSTGSDYTLSMETENDLTYDTVLQAANHWPPAQRFALIQDLLKTLEPPALSPTFPKRRTLDKALGLLKTNQPTPTDEEIRHILHDARMEEYS